MRFTVQRENILKPLQFVIGVVEKRQTLPVLSNVLIEAKDNTLSFTATDLEVEIVASVQLDISEKGLITLPARKFVDICRALPEDSKVDVWLDAEKDRVVIRSGRSRFNLATLPATDFPNIEEVKGQTNFTIPQSVLKNLIEKTQFSMAQQDVRFYLNGLLLEVSDQVIKAVATDGHRLSYCERDVDVAPKSRIQVILPRKGVVELAKLLEDSETLAEVIIGTNHIRVNLPNVQFTSKLVDGQFPDYERVIPKHGNKEVITNRELLRSALVRTSILSNEKYRGIRIRLQPGLLQAQAHNPEMEEAEEEVEVSYQGDNLEIGFNVNYLMEALAAIPGESVKMIYADPNSSCLILPVNENVGCKYVVMPMRL
ncbi:MAG: DNA polymerase III subunit beta [Gammaproteobacteria bacterium]|nr:DNA polymerase III subunit beta [Gammaproteobacteria bacterium]